MKRTLYPISAGVYTPIPATQFARMVELQEDGSGSGVGLAVKFPEDGFTQVFDYPPAQQPVVLGDKAAFGAGRGYIVGIPVQTGLNARAADTYVMVAAMSGSTSLRVTEHN